MPSFLVHPCKNELQSFYVVRLKERSIIPLFDFFVHRSSFGIIIINYI